MKTKEHIRQVREKVAKKFTINSNFWTSNSVTTHPPSEDKEYQDMIVYLNWQAQEWHSSEKQARVPVTGGVKTHTSHRLNWKDKPVLHSTNGSVARTNIRYVGKKSNKLSCFKLSHKSTKGRSKREDKILKLEQNNINLVNCGLWLHHKKMWIDSKGNNTWRKDF